MRGCLPNSLQPFYTAITAAAGLLIGSFLNVCIYRVMRDLSVVRPRSFCPQCEKPIAWYDNVPLLSFLILRGRCRGCSTRIPWRYPLVEALTAAAFSLVAYRYGFTLAALKWMVFESLMIVLFWTDLEERILPDEFTLGGAVAGAVFAFFVLVPGVLGQLWLGDRKLVWQSLFNMGLGAALISGPIWLAGAIYAKLRKREGLGLGDVKLLAMLGTFLGADQGIGALLIGAVSGSILTVAYLLLTRKDPGGYELPFGSFLCAAAAFIPFWSRMGETITGK
jgi:leader peptidase (prepilin peptidase)/N-methyltransferase